LHHSVFAHKGNFTGCSIENRFLHSRRFQLKNDCDDADKKIKKDGNFLKKAKIIHFLSPHLLFYPHKKGADSRNKERLPLLQTIFPGDLYEIVILHNLIVILHSLFATLHSRVVTLHSVIVILHSLVVILHSVIVILHSLVVILQWQFATCF